MVTVKFRWINSPVSGSNATAEANTVAFPPVNSATDLPWKRDGTVCTVTLHGVVPSHVMNVEKKPLIGAPACNKVT